MKILPVGTNLFHTDGQTRRSLRSFTKAPKNKWEILWKGATLQLQVQIKNNIKMDLKHAVRHVVDGLSTTQSDFSCQYNINNLDFPYV